MSGVPKAISRQLPILPFGSAAAASGPARASMEESTVSLMVENIAGVLKRPGRLKPMEPIRIEVIGKDESSNAQARTYAEYKVFAALAQHTPHVRAARVVLQRYTRNGTCDTVACSVTVALVPSGSVHTRACGQHAYAAINRAVERIGDLMRRRAA
jgi:ribosome-associated translation inhibitor RaiA